MASPTIAVRVLDELRRSSWPLDDDELAARLGVRPRQTINQVCRRLERSDQLRRYTGPEGKIVNDVCRSSSGRHPTAAVPAQVVPSEHVGGPSAKQGASWPGCPVTAASLCQAGFQPLVLRVTSLSVDLAAGRGCEWATIGEVPDSPGLYAFTVEDGEQIRVTYVGLTGNLWMVTKGRLPASGGARGGQRYGRPRHAGVTRQRINIRIAGQLRAGRVVRHWIRPLPAMRLRAEEERLIITWDLRCVGWNRG